MSQTKRRPLTKPVPVSEAEEKPRRTPRANRAKISDYDSAEGPNGPVLFRRPASPRPGKPGGSGGQAGFSKSRGQGSKDRDYGPKRGSADDRPKKRAYSKRDLDEGGADPNFADRPPKRRPANSRFPGDSSPTKPGRATGPRGAGSERPRRTYKDRDGSEDRPRRTYKDRDGSEDRPRRTFKDRDGSEDRPKRTYKDRDGSEDRPKRTYKDRDGSEERPKRTYKDRAGSEDRPKRTYKDRAGSETRPKRTFRDRDGSEDRPQRTYSDRASSDARPPRTFRDRAGSRNGADDRPPRSFRDRDERPQTGSFDRFRSSGPKSPAFAKSPKAPKPLSAKTKAALVAAATRELPLALRRLDEIEAIADRAASDLLSVSEAMSVYIASLTGVIQVAKIGRENLDSEEPIQLPGQIFKALAETLPRFGESSNLILTLAGFHDQVGQRLIRVHDCLASLQAVLEDAVGEKTAPSRGFSPSGPKAKVKERSQDHRDGQSDGQSHGQSEAASDDFAASDYSEKSAGSEESAGSEKSDGSAESDGSDPSDALAASPAKPRKKKEAMVSGLAARAKNRDKTLAGPTEDSLTQDEVDSLMKNLFKS